MLDEPIVCSAAFTGGVALGISLRADAAAAAGIPLAVLLLLTKFFRQKGQKKEKLFLFCVFATGLFCGMVAEDAQGWRWERAEGWADALRRLVRSLPYRRPETAELVCALLTGDRSGLSAPLKAAFRQSGASHLLALSGMHIGILYLAVTRLLQVLGNAPAWKKIRSAGIILLCGAYTLAVGAGPSIVRAFLFIFLRETAVLLERRVAAKDVFCSALILQLALSPPVLREIGFQLSYLAMAGITFVFPHLQAWWTEPAEADRRPAPLRAIRKMLRRVWELSALSLSCQLFTGPLAWWKFGTFPLWFLLTNLLCAPLMTLLMTASLLTVVLAAAGSVPPALLTLDEACCRALSFTLETIASMSA